MRKNAKTGNIELKIERGIPAPLPRSLRGKELPFDAMKIGDSFLYPIPKEQDRTKIRNRLAQACSQRKRRNPAMNFTLSWDGNGVRVWRIAP